MTIIEERAANPAAGDDDRPIGYGRIQRKEDPRFVRGKGNYVDDIVLPGMLHGAILRSPVAHARLVSIDTSATLAHPGVVAVITGQDLLGLKLAWAPTLSADVQAVLATDKVRFQGQEVAFVIAEDRYSARDALELIEVDYDVLPPVIDVRKALDPDAPVIRDDIEGRTDNHIFDWEAGDAAETDAVFASADVVVSQEMVYPRVHPAPMETCGAVADFEPIEGALTLYETSQAPHAHRTLFAIPADQRPTESAGRETDRQEPAFAPAGGGSEDIEAPERESILMMASAEQRLHEMSFADLAPDEVAQMRALVRRISLSTPERVSRRIRKTSSTTPRLDLRRTVRAAQRNGGEPLRLVYRRRRTRLSRLVLLCDVSGSMEPYTRVFLSLLQGSVAGAQVEAFVFSTRLTRPTRQLATAGRWTIWLWWGPRWPGCGAWPTASSASTPGRSPWTTSRWWAEWRRRSLRRRVRQRAQLRGTDRSSGGDPRRPCEHIRESEDTIMQIDSTFCVVAPIDQVWKTLMDFERVAGCVPGAQVLNKLSDDAYQVGMKVKLGPVTMQYKGQMTVLERDAPAHRAVFEGRAQETRGQGTAQGTPAPPTPAARPAAAPAETSLNALALAKGILTDQLSSLPKLLGLLAVVAYVSYRIGRRAGGR